jgi:hypothetical protein
MGLPEIKTLVAPGPAIIPPAILSPTIHTGIPSTVTTGFPTAASPHEALDPLITGILKVK